MRFTEDGPSIPDELLNARDEGRVVFFCGAGVSRARAGLPDFFGLAEAVIRELGVSEDSDARKVLDKAREIEDELSVSGLISADRVFGFLEQEFTAEDIHSAVARALAPNSEPDLSAHQILLRLATTSELRMQLVTTNFDRLFDNCDGEYEIYQPPRLPNPSRYDDLDGVVYLHGRVNDDYSGADGDGFILSSSEFGYAYLSEGWATEFFREIVRGYIVVFVGYSADDPPIHYLLEGLRRTQDSSHRIYAFQSDKSDEATAQWRHKGVEAIPYALAGRHRALWETLELWAQRADEPISWRQTVVDLAMDGPEKLQPHQRGQLAHIVSTYEGARAFADRTPPAEWLCSFDPSCRYARPERSEWVDPEGSVINPFTLYGLDSDATPEMVDPNNQYVTRNIPQGAWDAFVANSLDSQNLPDESFPAVRGFRASHMPRLPKRLAILSTWIASVANQPAALWWAARQESLHPSIRKGIEWELEQLHGKIDPNILKSWRYLLEGWERTDDESAREWYDLKRQIDREGWGPAAIRRFIAITRPYLKAGPALMSKPTPPKKDADFRLWDLVRLAVECPVPPQDADIPDEWLEHVIRGLRKNIELAVQLCEEVDDRHRFHISPIVPDDRPDISNYARTHGLSGYVIRFATLFERLVELDASKARRELLAWPIDDEAIFTRLRIWTGGKQELTTPNSFYQIVEGLTNDAFWSHEHRRDLLVVLAKRWGELPKESRKQIEDRLLAGPAKWEGEDDAEYENRRTWAILNRLRWLADKECDFSFDVEKEINKLRPAAPKWMPKYAKHAADSMEMQSGNVATNTEHSILLHEPIGTILSRASELEGRMEDNFLEERAPFAGLCAERPVRAYLALVHAARRNDFPEWAWKTFLNSPGREKDEPKFSATIAERLCRIPDEDLTKLLYASTSWLQKNSKALAREYPEVFDKVVARFIDVVHLEPSEARSAIIDVGRGRDWVTAALNSPVGHIALAILEDSRLEGIDGDVDLSANWLIQLVRPLALSGNPRRHAIAIISHHLGWFHRLIPEWTEHNLLSILDADDVGDQEALWAGFFWNPKVTSVELYLRLKPALLALAKQSDWSREGHVQSLAYLILSGWISLGTKKEERQVSSDELREVLLHGGDDFRSHILWQIGRGLRDKENTDLGERLGRAVELFQDVWPRQRAVKNPVMSLRLVELLFSSRESFPNLAEVVLPLLTRVDQCHGLYLRDEVYEIISNHAQLIVSILHAILPDEVSSWPYGIGDVLEKIGEADSDLHSDTRLQDLRRKWAAR